MKKSIWLIIAFFTLSLYCDVTFNAALVSAQDPLNMFGPVAKAGWDNFAKVGETVAIDGSSSLDPTGGPLTYLWAEDTRNPITGLIANGNQAIVQITPTVKGDYIFHLNVSNANGQATDAVTIHVIDPGDLPEGEAISAILDTYQAFQTAFQSEDINAIMDLYHPDFFNGIWQNGPRDKTVQREVLEGRFNAYQALKIDHHIITVNLRGPSQNNLIEADLLIFEEVNWTDSQGQSSRPSDLYTTILKKDGQTGKWLIYGNQLPYGAIIQNIYGKDEWGPWTGVWVGVKADRWDPNQGPVTDPITSVHLQGPTLPNLGVDLSYNLHQNQWERWIRLAEDPLIGWGFTVSVYRDGLNPSSRILRVSNVLEGYPNPIYPASPGYPQSPAFNVHLQPLFLWTDQSLKDHYYYHVRVSTTRSNEGIIWERPNIKGLGVRYNDNNLGVPLAPDQIYFWNVRAIDLNHNSACSDWQVFFTAPTDGNYTPRVEPYPPKLGVFTERQLNGNLALIIDVRAYDPDGSITYGNVIAYGPGDSGPILGSLYYDSFWQRWRYIGWINDETDLSGTYTVRVTDADGKFSEYKEQLAFEPLESAPEILYPKDTTITTVVPKLEWTIPPGAVRSWIDIRDSSDKMIFNYWVMGASQFQLPGGILSPEKSYRWHVWSVREEDSSKAAVIDNAAFSGWANFNVGQVVEIDSDGDGLFDSIEAILGTNPNDKDTDDDGLMDGDEDLNHNGVVEQNLGETDPRNIDTDGDLVQDGTEKGITVATVNTDTSVFKPDADPSTTTNPLYWDSDYDGLADGVEDDGECNSAYAQNGRVDECETDPLDDDTDDDGLTDGPWGSEDMNANGRWDPEETNALNADTDGDGIQDGTEKGLTKPEGFSTDLAVFIPDEDPWTTTDPTNADSDGDGIPDGEEDLNKNGKTDEGETNASIHTVDIDVKPGDYPNSINPKSKGKIPVAILSTQKLHAPDMVNKDSLTFGSAGEEASLAFCNPKGEDINGDGLKDLVCHFYVQDASFQCGDTKGILKGSTVDGTPVEGSDSVMINPCKM
jgi:ketosteroid isomerase-like protein